MEPKEFGIKIKDIRIEKDKTMVDVSDKSGLTQGFLSLLENGHKSIPKPETLKKLADGLDIEYEHMLYLAGIIDRDLFEKRININEEIKDRKQLLSETSELQSYTKKQLNLLIQEWKKLDANTTDSPYDEDKRDLLKKLEEKIKHHERIYNSRLLRVNRMQKDIMNATENMVSLNELINIKENVSGVDKEDTQSQINDLTSNLINSLTDEELEEGLEDISERVLKVNLPLLDADKDLLYYLKLSDGEIQKMLFDLHDLLNMSVELRYKDRLLSKEDRKKILTLLSTVFD